MAKGRVDAAHSEAKILDEYRALVDTARNNLQVLTKNLYIFTVLINVFFFLIFSLNCHRFVLI